MTDREPLRPQELIGVRQRLPQDPAVPVQVKDAQQTVLDLNAEEKLRNKETKRTYGRTRNGTVFTVPQTHDMVSQLLSPTQPKNISDAIVIGILASLVGFLYVLPANLRVPVFAVVYLFWRAAYNAGIGWLLYQQSNYNKLVNWARDWKLFDKTAHPTLYGILKREMETKIPKDYSFDQAPIEYNTWLVFRRVVDLILMCDFVSYCLFAVACSGRPAGELMATTIGRWLAGWALVLFNLWVKLDAHRVVKDFAWYWGDFFYLIDQELTFDGVFEMAPHPMYSVGYAGYYGISLMAGSYKVLAISIVAHAAQFAFLAFVENPHIEKTYNPPPPRKQSADEQSPVPHTKDLLGVENIDLHRVTDCAAIFAQVYFYSLAVFTPSTLRWQTFFVLNALFWRMWYSIGIGYILDRQSRKKLWTRHFIKYGETIEEAWRQWKGIYHLSMTMCYVSFVTASYKMYSLPPDWSYGMATLRHVVGTALIALQLWTIVSMYDSLGEFGWFFGDFFFDRGNKLTYSGIYRFLNNPERVIGLAGVWGFALITWSKSIFFLAFLSHILTLCFIQFVEQPHMQKRYGQRIRQDSGLSRSVRRSLPASIQQWQGSVDRMLEETADKVEEFFETNAPKFVAGVDNLVQDTKSLLRKYPVNMHKPSPDLSGMDRGDYTVSFEGTLALLAASEKASDREGELAQKPTFRGKEFQPTVLEYGAPIKVKWTAPINHTRKDWIGLYMLADNSSPSITRISSQGRWIATTAGAYDGRAEEGLLVSSHQQIQWSKEKGQPLMTGEMEFKGDKLWWTTGVFEFRYHHDGKHHVMAASQPFEIRIGKFDEDEEPVHRERVEAVLLPILRNCFDQDPEIAPSTVDESFGSLVDREGKFAKRLVYALRQM